MDDDGRLDDAEDGLVDDDADGCGCASGCLMGSEGILVEATDEDDGGRPDDEDGLFDGEGFNDSDGLSPDADCGRLDEAENRRLDDERCVDDDNGGCVGVDDDDEHSDDSSNGCLLGSRTDFAAGADVGLDEDADEGLDEDAKEGLEEVGITSEGCSFCGSILFDAEWVTSAPYNGPEL